MGHVEYKYLTFLSFYCSQLYYTNRIALNVVVFQIFVLLTFCLCPHVYVPRLSACVYPFITIALQPDFCGAVSMYLRCLTSVSPTVQHLVKFLLLVILRCTFMLS